MADYLAWHSQYDKLGSALHLRLLVVQDLIASVLDDMPPGPVRVTGLCVGQGRDLLTVARRHRRGTDLTGRLIELDDRNVAVARKCIEKAGLKGLEVIKGDAGNSDIYAGTPPADLILACGLFGNIREEEVKRTVSFLPALGAPGARIIWTRFPRDDGIIFTIQRWLSEAGFEPRTLIVPQVKMFGVGMGQLIREPPPFRTGQILFGPLR